jgi:hypothetical protein
VFDTSRDIIAASPIVRETGLLPHRIVIRDLGGQYVVHMQVLEPGKKPWYHQGDHFSKRQDEPAHGQSCDEALCEAWVRFEERTRCSLNMDSPCMPR